MAKTDECTTSNCQACADIDRLTEAYKKALEERYGDRYTTVVNTSPHPHTGEVEVVSPDRVYLSSDVDPAAPGTEGV